MAAKPLELHPAALDELKSGLIWYAERSKPAAINFLREVDSGIDFIMRTPETCPAGDYGTRRFTLKRFPFAIIYRETETAVQVVAVAHGHRRPGYWKKRL